MTNASMMVNPTFSGHRRRFCIICADSMSSPRRLLCCFFLLAGSAGFPGAAQTQSNQQTQKVPTIDGGAGPCSLELTVTTPDTKPVYAATIKVHIAYGFAGLHKLDLDAGTDAD